MFAISSSYFKSSNSVPRLKLHFQTSSSNFIVKLHLQTSSLNFITSPEGVRIITLSSPTLARGNLLYQVPGAHGVAPILIATKQDEKAGEGGKDRPLSIASLNSCRPARAQWDMAHIPQRIRSACHSPRILVFSPNSIG